ncbi:MAG TPA: hypothetical protein VJM12_15375 [Pyrinomonadaceae bacterium]|nr:hypothetical protein [Pyrinomonadaceae bacterium]
MQRTGIQRSFYHQRLVRAADASRYADTPSAMEKPDNSFINWAKQLDREPVNVWRQSINESMRDYSCKLTSSPPSH